MKLTLLNCALAPLIVFSVLSIPPSTLHPYHAVPVAVLTSDSNVGTLLVVNQGDADLSIIDPATAREVARVPEGAFRGHEVATSLDGKLVYIPIYGDASVGASGTDGREIVVVDLALRKVVNHLRFTHGVRPHCILMNPADGLLYVTTELDRTVTVINPETLKIVGAIPTGQAESHMLAISHDGRFGYTANVGPGTVSVLDLKLRRLVRILPISGEVQRISISHDDKMVFTADQSNPRLAVINTATDKVNHWIPLPGIAWGTASTPDGRWLLVTLPDTAQIAVVDLRTLEVVRKVAVPGGPRSVLVTPDNQTAYVSCMDSNKIAAINVADWSVKAIILVGHNADGIAWASTKSF